VIEHVALLESIAAAEVLALLIANPEQKGMEFAPDLKSAVFPKKSW
jgi:hypothetical protein